MTSERWQRQWGELARRTNGQGGILTEGDQVRYEYEQLAHAMTDIVTPGALDKLTKENIIVHGISMSRLGSYVNRDSAE